MKLCIVYKACIAYTALILISHSPEQVGTHIPNCFNFCRKRKIQKI